MAAASDLADALPELVRAFQASHPSVKVESTIGSSGQLAKQIESGAPVDVFLSADRGFVEGLAEKGLVDPSSIRPYAVGRLVLIARTEMGERVKSLDDLEKAEVTKIAIANPDHAPYGRAARQALEKADLWSRLEERIVLADTVRQAVQYVESGNADAGLVSASLVVGREPPGIAVDAGLYQPIVQALGVVKESASPEEARAFADFMLGEEARSILQSRGLHPPDSEGAR